MPEIPTPLDQIFQPRLRQPFLYASSISQPGTFSSPRGSLSAGIEIVNSDKELDSDFLNKAIIGQDVLIKIGGTLFEGRAEEQVLFYPEYETIFDGKVNSFQWDDDIITVALGDVSVLLDEPMQKNLYAGTGGLEGDSDLTGLPKPIALGRVFNAAAVLVDSANLIYQFNDGAMQEVIEVRDRGVALAFDADYADITTATPGLSEYATSLATGYIKLGGSPDGLITGDIKGDSGGPGYQENVSFVAEKIARQFGDFEDSQIDSNSINNLNVLFPYPSGFYTGTSEVLTSGLLNEFLLSLDGWWAISRTGQFTVGAFSSPENEASSDSYNETNILNDSFNRLPTIAPIWRFSLGFQRNFSQQDGDALAASVTAANRRLYSQDYLRNIQQSDSTKTQFPTARDIQLDTLLTLEADAETLAQSILARYRVRRDMISFSVINKMYVNAIGAIGSVNLESRGFDRKMIIVGVTENAQDRATEIILWG